MFENSSLKSVWSPTHPFSPTLKLETTWTRTAGRTSPHFNRQKLDRVDEVSYISKKDVSQSDEESEEM